MSQILEDNWNLGWIPSYSQQKDFGSQSNGLLRMDNLTLEEKGSLRLAKTGSNQSNVVFPHDVDSIFSLYSNGLKYRYIYSNRNMVRNYGTALVQNTYDKSVFTGGTETKAWFGAALGNVFLGSGTKRYKDNLTDINPLDIPAPAAPSITSTNATETIDCNNLDGSGNYTNWSSDLSPLVFDNTGTVIEIKANNIGLTSRCYTDFTTPLDMTEFGGITGKDTPNDIFSFILSPEILVNFQWIQIIFNMDDYSGNYVNYAVGVISSLSTPGVKMQILRSSFTTYGTFDWNAVKSIQIDIQLTTQDNLDLTQYNTISNFDWSGGLNTNIIATNVAYIAVQVRSDGTFMQFSLASMATADISTNAGLTLNLNSVTLAAPTAVDAQCNQYWLFRYSDATGEYLLVDIQIGTYGFTPTSYTDTSTELTLEFNAAQNLNYTLQAYRTQLPDDIIGTIWFNDRIIYLTEKSFIPSFELDPGSYDSRFVYELNQSIKETCLFICKINVGMFVIATTNDFYQVYGTFALQNTGTIDNPVYTLDVTIKSLGVSDPSVSRSFVESNGSIIYMSSTGIRTLVNSSSSLITDPPLGLTFRGENRYGVPAAQVLPADQSIVALASNGTRIYCSLPFTDNVNRMFCYTMIPALNIVSSPENYWRLTTEQVKCMIREEDGMVLCGGFAGSYLTATDSQLNTIPINLQTQLNFGNSPESRKDANELILFINTGGNLLNLILMGIDMYGNIQSHDIQFNTSVLSIIRIDVNEYLPPCLAYGLQITGNTNQFEFNYFIIEYISRSPIVLRQLQIPTNFGKPVLKKLTTWPFLVDSLGSILNVEVIADGQVVPGVLDKNYSNDISTFNWFNSKDILAIDWSMLVTCENGMEFYKFLSPNVVQVFPIGRLIDQLGPFDFKGITEIFGMRLRVFNTNTKLNYTVYDADGVDFTDTIQTTPNIDQSYGPIIFPKGIDPSVCKISLSSVSVFYRFSLELKVRKLGKETEDTYVSVG